MTPHPAKLIQKLGVREAPATVAVSITALLQYLLLFRLWEGYPLRAAGDAIHPNVVTAALLLSTLGAAAIVALSLHAWIRGVAAARRLEKPATDHSFAAIRQRLITLTTESTLSHAPELLYTPKNAEALEVREYEHGAAAVVVGLDQRKNERIDPEVFAAKLGHEISHLELGATRIETNARRAVVLHFRLLAWLVSIFVIVIGFIDPRGIGSDAPYWGFAPVFAGEIYTDLSAHFVVLLLSSAIIFVYSYFFIVRREHIHDLRGSQFLESPVLATRVFTVAAGSRSIFQAVRNFFELHPSDAARARVILDRDFVLLSIVFFPLIVGGIPGPFLQLLTGGWRQALGIEEQWWNLSLTVFGGVLFYLILSADLSRLGLAVVLGRRNFLAILVYSGCAGLATQIPRVFFEVLYGLRRGLEPAVIINRVATGFLAGGVRITLMIALSLLALTFLSAIRIAALGEAGAGRMLWLDRLLGVVVLTGAFAIASLTTIGFIIDVLAVLAVVALCGILAVISSARCGVCRRPALSALRLSSRCPCGRERLPYLQSLQTNYGHPHPSSAMIRPRAAATR
jgi:hypothetical protein